MIGQSGKREEQVGEAIEIDKERLRHLFFLREGNHAALRATTRCAREMEARYGKKLKRKRRRQQ